MPADWFAGWLAGGRVGAGLGRAGHAAPDKLSRTRSLSEPPPMGLHKRSAAGPAAGYDIAAWELRWQAVLPPRGVQPFPGTGRNVETLHSRV